MRIFITIATRLLHEPLTIDTLGIQVFMLCITIVDWITPFSLLYLYKQISEGNRRKNQNNNKQYDSRKYYETVNTESIDMILREEEDIERKNKRGNDFAVSDEVSIT